MYKVTVRQGDIETVYYTAARSEAVARCIVLEALENPYNIEMACAPVSEESDPVRVYSINLKTGEMS